jgi:transcriptional regulator with XRE-family HTH domain
MSQIPPPPTRLTGHALRNANLRERSLARAREAPPLARALVTLRARVLQMTRLEFARRSGISRGTLRDLELGVHVPTRRILQQFVDFCRNHGAPVQHIDEVCSLYAGAQSGLAPLISRLELRAGSPGELARRAEISPATLWEYRRGNFPLPLAILRRLCQVVGEDPAPAEVVWFQSERQRFLARGYPPALAEFWTLCTREDYSEKHLASLGLGTAALRRLRYLELPAWEEVARAARALCQNEQEWQNLERLWRSEEATRQNSLPDPFGSLLQQARKRLELGRREVADLFGIGGKKPARIIKSIEEDGCYSAQAYPAGLAALLEPDEIEQGRLLELWEERRKQFHRRHRPETRIDLRLARERYGFEHKDMVPILGYSPLEYQRIERGVDALSDAARARILQAVHRAGQTRVEALLEARNQREVRRGAWRVPPTVRELISRLAAREGGILPLMRLLRQAGVNGLWAERLRSIERGDELPVWPLLAQIGAVCGVPNLSAVLDDWRERYRNRLHTAGCSPLGAEVRLLIAEVALTVRAFSARVKVHPSGLTRDLQRLDSGRLVRWRQVERILVAAGLASGERRWEQIHAWWYATLIESEAPLNGARRRRSC